MQIFENIQISVGNYRNYALSGAVLYFHCLVIQRLEIMSSMQTQHHFGFKKTGIRGHRLGDITGFVSSQIPSFINLHICISPNSTWLVESRLDTN